MDFEQLKAACAACTRCELCRTRTNIVLERGSRTAKLMFVGEAPGKNEDEQGVPFVGAAGQLFDKYLEAVGIERDEVYICNILKCRPPQNRDPLPAEQDACIDFLRAQVRLVDPKIIACLGRISAAKLISPDLRITRDHGKFYQKGKFLMCALYHPSALLRDPRNREDNLRDMLALKAEYDKIKAE